MFKDSLSDYNLNSIGDLLDLRKECRKRLRRSIDYMDIACVFFYVRLIDILNILIRKKGYK